ncbi:hypothetical protein V8G54_012961 [Vigna mungo]|uniref:Uncharacterized protein n=1 Tax=Vigna mungo TaxID=3915 RepID=A0AAQ3NT86_VIGMU
MIILEYPNLGPSLTTNVLNNLPAFPNDTTNLIRWHQQLSSHLVTSIIILITMQVLSNYSVMHLKQSILSRRHVIPTTLNRISLITRAINSNNSLFTTRHSLTNPDLGLGLHPQLLNNLTSSTNNTANLSTRAYISKNRIFRINHKLLSILTVIPPFIWPIIIVRLRVGTLTITTPLATHYSKFSIPTSKSNRQTAFTRV